MEERRKIRRFPCMGSADIRAEGQRKSSRIVVTALYNMSASGMKCAPGLNVEKDTPVDVYLFEFMGRPVDIRLKGKVAWLAQGPSEYMGIMFDEEITEETQPELYRFICESCDGED